MGLKDSNKETTHLPDSYFGTVMLYRRQVMIVWTLVVTFSSLILSNPLRSTSGSNLIISSLPQEVNNSLAINVPKPVNISFSGTGCNSSFTNLTTEVDYWTTTWTITPTLSLIINVGAWELSPEKILQTLDAAQTTIGKKTASTLLDGKFTQETGSRINTMVFEIRPPIGPSWEVKHLTWADVGEVVGEKGLMGFFKQTNEWHSVYFDVVDSRRGKLGNGAVRKWYMLEPASRAQVIQEV